MKPFDIEAAKAGAKVITRDGRDVRIVCFDRKSTCEYSLVALVDEKNNEDCHIFTKNGHFYSSGTESPHDIFMAPVKKEGWINLYKHINSDKGIVAQAMHPTKEDAERNILLTLRHISTVHIEWEE